MFKNIINSLKTKDCNFFLSRMYFISNDGSQNVFVYQTTLDTLEINKDKGTDSVLSSKSMGRCTFELKPLYTAFLHSIKLSGYKIGIKFDKDPLAVEQNKFDRNCKRL